MTAVGASRPLPSVPTKVRLLNRLSTLDLGGGDYSSCPTADLRPPRGERWRGVRFFRKSAASDRDDKCAEALGLDHPDLWAFGEPTPGGPVDQAQIRASAIGFVVSMP